MITIDPIKRPPKKLSSVDTTEIMKEIDQKIADLIGGAPEKLDTINELADAIDNLPNLDNFVTNETLNKLLSVSKYEFVDLGLPSGLKWASTNVGAEKPEDFGLYFAWGETQGYEGVTIDKQFTWDDYKFGTVDSLTKYNNVDGLTTLELEDDAIYQSDNTCRMPTSGECQELIDNTTSTWETLNGVDGRRFTSKTNGNSIFVPAAGYCLDGLVNYVGDLGCFCSSSRDEIVDIGVWSLFFKSNNMSMTMESLRYWGFQVRAVQEANVNARKFDPSEVYNRLDALKSEVEVEVKIEDGVYAVSATGEFINYNSADATALGVALVVGEHKFMIAKADATDGTNTTLYWTKSTTDLSLSNYANVDGTNNYGYFDYTSAEQLNKDFTTWTAGALSEFNGKANTAVIAEASSDARDMCTVLDTFNASDSYNDWYVPALGQLALMYLNKTEINAALEKIGGTALTTKFYWSSSESSSNQAWPMSFENGYISNGSKYLDRQVRFVRNILVPKQSLKEKVSELEQNTYTKSEIDNMIISTLNTEV